MSNAHARVKHRKAMNKTVQNEVKSNNSSFRGYSSGVGIIRRSKDSKVFSLEKKLKDELMFFTYQSFFSLYVQPSTSTEAGLIKMKNYFDSLTVTENNFLELYSDRSRAWE